MKLYTYFRSSAAFRVRIALKLKGLPVDAVPVHLTRAGGEQLKPPYADINPGMLVPCLVDGEHTLTQSMAIIEYLDEVYPALPLLPREAAARARVRALSQMIACDIHPIDNLRVLRYLVGEMGLSEAKRDEWYKHWIQVGFRAIEQQLARDPATGRFCHGDTPTMADCLLVPQVFNAKRAGLEVDLTPFPTIVRIFDACMAIEAFQSAQPARQPDAE